MNSDSNLLRPVPGSYEPYLAGSAGSGLAGELLTLGVGLGRRRALREPARSRRAASCPNMWRTAPTSGLGQGPLRYYLVFMFVGTLLGGLVSAIMGRRVRPQLERGPTASRGRRIVMALAGASWLGSRAGWLRAAPRGRR